VTADRPDVSVVMPAYNEAAILPASVAEVVEGLRDAGTSFELVVVENGSTDDTPAIARGLAAQYPEVRVEHLPEGDYGRALRAGLLAARGDAVVNFDADYFDVGFLHDAVARVTAPGGPAVVVASKRAPGARDTRPPLRRLVTATFSLLLRAGFGLRVSDTHGMKAMRRSAVDSHARRCRFGQDLFDTELILRVERAGLATDEIPVAVVERRPARTSILRRVPRTLAGLVRLRLALWRERAPGRRPG
jgi:glycosyltransferase involved in cell wall biosynthesis